ncbi:MAG: hypothetical protein ACPGOY_17670 [Rhodospirillaceae bacterium]
MDKKKVILDWLSSDSKLKDTMRPRNQIRIVVVIADMVETQNWRILDSSQDIKRRALNPQLGLGLVNNSILERITIFKGDGEGIKFRNKDFVEDSKIYVESFFDVEVLVPERDPGGPPIYEITQVEIDKTDLEEGRVFEVSGVVDVWRGKKDYKNNPFTIKSK